MSHDPVIAAFRAEANQLATEMLRLEPADWSRPTACVPWTVAELFGHVLTAVTRVPDMIAAPAPDRADVSARDYYRPDERFSAQTNTERIETGRDRAASGGHTLAREFDDAWPRIARACAEQPPDRVVRTRHGDAMRLTDFVITRIVELGIHGLDLAAALGRQPWLTPPAAETITTLLLGDGGIASLDALGWDMATFLGKATGRAPLSEADTAELDRAGIHWLALG